MLGLSAKLNLVVGVAVVLVCETSVSHASTKYCNETLECGNLGTALSYDNIYCQGFMGCFGTDLECDEYCECNGLYACHGSEITAESNVVCDGEYGCKYAHITADNNIFCDGQYGCKFTELTASNNIYCGGEYGCRLNEIFGANYLYAGGSGALSESSIKSFNRLYAYGYLALQNATMNTSGISSVIAIFGGRQTAYNAKFICDSSSTCNIYCQNSDSCENLKVYCYGTCNIDCDDDCSECPTEISTAKGYDMKQVTIGLQKQIHKQKTKREEQKRLEMINTEKYKKKTKQENFGIAGVFGANPGSSGTVLNGNELVLGVFAGFISCLIIMHGIKVCGGNNKDDGAQYESLL